MRAADFLNEKGATTAVDFLSGGQVEPAWFSEKQKSVRDYRRALGVSDDTTKKITGTSTITGKRVDIPLPVPEKFDPVTHLEGGGLTMPMYDPIDIVIDAATGGLTSAGRAAIKAGGAKKAFEIVGKEIVAGAGVGAGMTAADFLDGGTITTAVAGLAGGVGTKAVVDVARTATKKALVSAGVKNVDTVADNIVDDYLETVNTKEVRSLFQKHFGQEPSPEKLSLAIGKPEQVDHLTKIGVTEPAAQVREIVRDAVEQPENLAKMAAGKGKVDLAEQLHSRAVVNGEKLMAADGPVTEQMVKSALAKPETKTTLYSNPIAAVGREIGKTYTKYIGSPVWDTFISKKIPEMLEKVPGGKAVNRAMIYGWRGSLDDPEKFNKALEDTNLAKSFGIDYAVDIGNRLSSVSEPEQMKLGQYVQGKTELSGPMKQLGDEAKDALYHLGRQAVDVGLLQEETFFKNAGRYMPRLYSSKEYQALLDKWNIVKPNRLDLSRFKARKDIPEEIRAQMGEILTPGFPVAKGIAQLTNDISMARFYNGIADNPKWSVKDGQVPEGWQQLPENKKLGALSGSYVHPEIYREVNESIRVAGEGEKIWNKALGAWKFGKVILSPKTHVRNMLSNGILAHIGGMPLYEQPYWLAKAARAMVNSSDDWAVAKQSGLLQSTFTNAELRTLFDKVTSQLDSVAAGSIQDKVAAIGSFTTGLRKAMNGAAKAYEAEEQVFKLAKFMHNRSQGISVSEAAEDAEKWLFNYSKMTQAQDKYRKKWYGAPFATFTFKALPRIAEAAVKTPWRFALPAAIVYGIEQQAMKKFGDTNEQVKAKKELRPEYMKGSFLGMPNFTRVPVSDDHGREYYLNLTYIFPWGDIGEGGGFGPIPGSLTPLSQPFVKEGFQQIANYDTFWKEPIVKSEDTAGMSKKDALVEQAKKRGEHVYRSLAPTPILDIEKVVAAYRGEPDYRGRERPDMVVAMDVIGGIKMYPVDYVEQVARKVAEQSPRRSEAARKIKSEIRSLEIKAQSVEKKGGDAGRYRKQIDNKINQLHGMAGEIQKTQQLHETASGVSASDFLTNKEKQNGR